MSGVPTAFARKAPTADDLVAIGRAVLDELGPEFRELMGDVAIVVEDWADEDTLKDMGIDDPLELTGLYDGVPLGERLAMEVVPKGPNLVHLYRLPILFEWCERGCALHEVVFDVLTHELGHNLGMDEDAVLRMEGRG